MIFVSPRKPSLLDKHTSITQFHQDFAVRVDTHEVVSMEVSTDDVHDSKEVAGLLEDACNRANIEEALFDGAYDSEEVYEELERRGIEAMVQPRGNARSDTGPLSRSVAVGMIGELGYETWAEEKGYGRRWAAETAFSTFKGLFGEHSLARSMDCIIRELVAKVSLYNMLVNM
jgi:hypothetical protein